MTVGNTRIVGNAGGFVDLTHYLQGELAELSAPLKKAARKWSFGTGAGAVNVIYADQITLSDGGNQTLDLYASGALLDVFNKALTMSALKFLYIKNNSTDSNLQVGGGSSLDIGIFADMTDKLIIPAGGDAVLWNDPSAAGLVITTNKNLLLTDDGSGAAGDKLIDVVAMGLD